MADNINFEFSILESEHQFRVESFQVHEKLSQPFEINVSLLSPDADIKFEELIRKPGVLILRGQGEGDSRTFHGVVKDVQFLGTGRSFSRYQLVLVPQLWFLSQRQDCRIFQDVSVKDIISDVLEKAGVTDYRLALTETYLQQEYILQYRENDLHFIHRLMSQHGIWYYFEHSNSVHTMVIVDSNDAILPLQDTEDNATEPNAALRYHADGGGVADREHIFDVSFGKHVRTDEVTITDYNYDHPRISQEVSASSSAGTKLAYFDYPGRYQQPVSGKMQAGYRLSEHLVDNCQMDGRSCVMRLIPGFSFEMVRHPRRTLNRDYTLLSVYHTGYNPRVHEEEAGDMPTTYDNQFICIPRDVIYRSPALPAPVVDGPQTAVVVGPTGEEIYTDVLGRVKVQFHWDRYSKSDEYSTCWIRVGQSMAAAGWGAVALPRIGHEVVVNFLDGDPDKPLVTGAVYNGLHFPPYPLPENKTRTAFRTQTHKGTGYNELSFEDKADNEEIYLRAQKDMITKVLNNRYREIGADEFLTVGGLQTNEIKGDSTETINGNKTTVVNSTFTETVEQDVTVAYKANETQSVSKSTQLDIGENRTTKIVKNDDLDVGSNSNLGVGASRAADVKKNDNLKVGGNLTVAVTGNTNYNTQGATQIISGEKIVLKAGGSQLVMGSDGAISITGTSITINGSDKVIIKGGKVAVN